MPTIRSIDEIQDDEVRSTPSPTSSTTSTDRVNSDEEKQNDKPTSSQLNVDKNEKKHD